MTVIERGWGLVSSKHVGERERDTEGGRRRVTGMPEELAVGTTDAMLR
jgi:hypothetical protein